MLSLSLKHCCCILLACCTAHVTAPIATSPSTSRSRPAQGQGQGPMAPYRKQPSPGSSKQRSSSRTVEARTNTGSRKLTIVTILAQPYVMLRVDTAFYVGNERFEGFIVDVIEALAASLGFEYELRLAEDGILGTVDRHGNWSGVVGELQRGEADIAAAPLAVSRDLDNVLDFTIPFLTFKSTALLRKPGTGIPGVGGAAATRSGATTRTLPNNNNNSNNNNLINSAEDILASDLTYGLLDGDVTQRDLQGSTNHIHQSLWSRVVSFWPPTIADSVEEGVQRVRQDAKGFAFFVDTATAEYVTSRRPCDLYAVEPFLDAHAYALAVRRGNSHLRDQINEQMGQLLDSHVLQQLYLKWWHSQCPLFRPSGPLSGAPSSRDPRHDVAPPAPPANGGGSGRRQQQRVTSSTTTAAVPMSRSQQVANALVSNVASSSSLMTSVTFSDSRWLQLCAMIFVCLLFNIVIDT